MSELSRLVAALLRGDLGVPSALLPRISRLEALFRSRFTGQADSKVFLGFVPGRIEILGKHTDYAGGHSIVCAINKGFLFLAGPNELGRIRMAEDSNEFEDLDFTLEPSLRPAAGSWANYPNDHGTEARGELQWGPQNDGGGHRFFKRHARGERDERLFRSHDDDVLRDILDKPAA